MTYVRTSYIEYSYPGGFFSSPSSVKIVESRDPSKLEHPKDACSFCFYDILTTTTTVDGEEIKLKSLRFNVSTQYFCGGQLYSLEEVRKAFPEKTTLISNMESEYNCSPRKFILCPAGNWRAFRDGDVLLER